MYTILNCTRISKILKNYEQNGKKLTNIGYIQATEGSFVVAAFRQLSLILLSFCIYLR
jgi:hypothetical protein